MIDYMHKVFEANKKYMKFNKIDKVEHMKEDYDIIFPPLNDIKV